MPETCRADIITSKLLASVPGLLHGFGTRKAPVPLEQLESWSETSRPRWKQVHGNHSAEVVNHAQECGEVDALWTRMPGRTLGVVTADCVPILMARRDGGAVAAIHAGWRGTAARIVEHLWMGLLARGQHPRDWLAAIGPCAHPCCYEVSEELSDRFGAEFGQKSAPAYRRIDLVAANRLQLESIGIEPIDTAPSHCTLCSKTSDGAHRFNSFRRDGSGGRQLSMISSLS